MKRIETAANASRGEIEVRSFSEKARRYYDGTDPLKVYCTEEGEFYYRDSDKLRGPFTREAIQADFEAIQDEIDANEED